MMSSFADAIVYTVKVQLTFWMTSPTNFNWLVFFLIHHQAAQRKTCRLFDILDDLNFLSSLQKISFQLVDLTFQLVDLTFTRKDNMKQTLISQ